ncbi:NAD(P)H-binding protein [Plantibacter sp. YIM 135347]|uniref:NAD(P)H-binding protein n=1 Tax=Plantibacter sp. YIM 135347 TaxID=3423919 RepID=UPI003D32F38A
MTRFLLTGATGNLGAAALHRLLERVPASDIAVLIRRPDDAPRFEALSVEPRPGDYDDPASLAEAFAGVERLLFVSSPILDPVRRAAQHRSVVAAAVDAGVRHVVYTSAMGAAHDPGHRAAESALTEWGGDHAILRNGLYSDAFVRQALLDAEAFGAVRSASDGARLVTTAVADLAEAAVLALLAPPSQSLLELRGPAWTYDDLATSLSDALGRPIPHELVDEAMTGPFAVLFPLVRRGVFAAESDDLARLLGRRPVSIGDVVAQQLAAGDPRIG